MASTSKKSSKCWDLLIKTATQDDIERIVLFLEKKKPAYCIINLTDSGDVVGYIRLHKRNKNNLLSQMSPTVELRPRRENDYRYKFIRERTLFRYDNAKLRKGTLALRSQDSERILNFERSYGEEIIQFNDLVNVEGNDELPANERTTRPLELCSSVPISERIN